MIVFLNGRFVPEDQALVSVFDRGFLYGDGLFETIRVCNGKPFRWAQHLQRLQSGAEFLRLCLPFAPEEIRRAVDQLVTRNQAPDAVLRITLSRGVGPRGYSPKGADQPTLVLSLHPAPTLDAANPPRWRLITASLRVPADEKLTVFKTCNRLTQVLARAEAEVKGADEALLLNTDGEVAETASSNVFWVEGNTVCTTPLASGALAGVTRAVIFELCAARSLRAQETSAKLENLNRADAVFLTVSSWGIVEAVALDGTLLPQSPLVATLRQGYRELVRNECGGRSA